MSALVMWINNHEAKIIKFTPNGTELKHLEKHGRLHHSEVHGRNHAKSEGDAVKFYNEVAEALRHETKSQWLIVGPGLAHTHFKHLVDKKYPELSKCIVGLEPMEELTTGQIEDHARRFFKHKGVFDGL